MTPLQVLHHHARNAAERTAFILGGDVWTYARLAAEVDRLAHGLVGRGLKKGDRVALHLPNGPELAVAYYACFRVGAIAAPLNIRMKHAELLPLLQRLRPTLYIGQRELYAKVAAVESSILPTNARYLIDTGSRDPRTQPWTRLFSDVVGGSLHVDVDVHAPALLLTTSGSTGHSKFVTHTLSTLAAISQAMPHLELDGSQVVVLAVPMVHASGCFTFLAGIWHGAPMVMFRRFDADAVLDAIRPRGCSFLLGLPYMFAELLESQRARPRTVDSLRFCLSGGDVCPAWLQAQFTDHFGVPLYSFWGATETLGSLTYSAKVGPVHGLVPGAEHRLLDERGNEVERGEVGELALRGPNVTIGYWTGPGRIEGGLAKEGWYMTGDLLRQDEDGDFWYVSRKKDLIIRGGSNIAPAEVERVLTAHPAVRDAGVVGVPDSVLGQRVAGFVALREGASPITAEQILADIASRLADYKLPERLRIVEAIPRNTLGKIDRRALLAMVPANTVEAPGVPAATVPLRLGRR